ncbi:hypothetical protein DN068_01120 [Taibaiella soli]|uniref:Uncharacterized protein n=1 Tax=Taibaiella soli TaxID=1649169 RepID=A0A2W2B461_9BACT|nr:hypothetical protein DN068_01120 [Taibaiella soli]
MPLSVISFLLLLFQIFHSGGEKSIVHKANPLVTAHHGFTFRKSCITRNFVYAIGTDELEDAENRGVEVSDVGYLDKVNTDAMFTSFEIVPNTARYQEVLKLQSRRLFLFHCNFRV